MGMQRQVLTRMNAHVGRDACTVWSYRVLTSHCVGERGKAAEERETELQYCRGRIATPIGSPENSQIAGRPSSHEESMSNEKYMLLITISMLLMCMICTIKDVLSSRDSHLKIHLH
jgi:hypothetical protein